MSDGNMSDSQAHQAMFELFQVFLRRIKLKIKETRPVVDKLIDNDAKLYQLESETRDLETELQQTDDYQAKDKIKSKLRVVTKSKLKYNTQALKLYKQLLAVTRRSNTKQAVKQSIIQSVSECIKDTERVMVKHLFELKEDKFGSALSLNEDGTLKLSADKLSDEIKTAISYYQHNDSDKD